MVVVFGTKTIFALIKTLFFREPDIKAYMENFFKKNFLYEPPENKI